MRSCLELRGNILFDSCCCSLFWFCLFFGCVWVHVSGVMVLGFRPSAGEVLSWAESLEALLTNQYGLAVFRHFLRSEFSEENLDFWLAVEKYKKTCPFSKMAARAAKIYDEFISTSASRQVHVCLSICPLIGPHASFQLAQDQIFGLMETDSYPRFLKSRLYPTYERKSGCVEPAL
uniref:RGS domain-containing protein n=1 Tax=Stegastes partitus TaxID=144197 RepID=A0A3B4ZI97_9TELE